MIVLHPSPARDYEKRRWDKWPELADHLVMKYGAVNFTGTDDQFEYVQSIIKQMHCGHAAANLCGAFDIPEFAKFLKSAQLIVTVNTATMHLGIVLEVPTVAIIGGTPAKVVIPRDNPLFGFVEDPALAQWNVVEATYGKPRINEITVEQVMEKVEEMAGRKP